ncbi:3-hydroxybutyryl-CoA dehydrogenase OS=Streptomyces antimycoticus OX=68175 GN=SANT12839_025650 PE=4 SV=1 [Streptomyces antimycoticus]
MAPPLRTIGVVGAGCIGASVCVDLVIHGFRVVAVDTDQTALDETRRLLRETNRFLPAVRPGLERLPAATADERLVTSNELDALAECEFVVENISELGGQARPVPQAGHGAARRGRHRRQHLQHPHRPAGRRDHRAEHIVGIHFMNPSYLKDAVEVMCGDDTSGKCLDHAKEILGLLGKQSVVVSDFPGFVSNRISHLFFNEAIRTVQDQGELPEVVDDIFKKCFGHTMGPLETADLIGLEKVLLTLEYLHESYQDDRYEACGMLREMVAANRLGRKSGQGFYHYRGTAAANTTRNAR